jgi:hypothetical protein
LIGVSVMKLAPLLPAAIVRLAGAAERVKLGAGVTVRAIVVLAVKAPAVAVTITVETAVAVAAPAARLSVLVWEEDRVPNAAVTPVGNPDTENVTEL